MERLEAEAAQQALPEPTAYRAPELAHGQPLNDPRIDVYSMGVLLYRLLCGRLPWEPNTEPLVLQHRKEGSKLPNPKRFQQDIPTEVLKVLRAATSGSPKVRPKSAVVLRAVLGPSGHSSSTTVQTDSSELETEDERTEADQAAPLQDNTPPPQHTPVTEDPTPTTATAPLALGDLETTVMEAADRNLSSSAPSDLGSAETTILPGIPRNRGSDHQVDEQDTTSSAPSSSESSTLGPPENAGPSPQLEVAVTTMHPSAVRAQQSSSKIRMPESSPTPDASKKKKGTGKRRGKKVKNPEAGSSNLWIGLVLGFGVLAIVGLVFALIFVRNMAQGPEATQLDELLRSSGVRPEAVENQDSAPENDEDLEDNPDLNAEEDTQAGDSLVEELSPPEGSPPEGSAEAPDSEQAREASAPAVKAKPKAKPKTTKSARKSKPKKKAASAPEGKDSDTQGEEESKQAVEAEDSPKLVLQKQALADTVSTGRRVSFTVAIPSPPKGVRLSVALRMQCPSDGARWRRYTMRRAGRTIWEKRVSFTSDDRGSCKYYFTAQTGENSTPTSLGSRAAPFDVKVR